MFDQVKLSYAFDALEPHIDPLTVQTHYTKHHVTYTKNFNDLVANLPQCAGKTAEEILSSLDSIPADVRTAVRNNGGGYYNHNLYFEMLSPNGGTLSGRLAAQIDKDFGGLDALTAELTKAAMGRFGSGYAWLVMENGKLKVTSSANQDSPLMEGNPAMLLTIDVWEHAYYLKYKNLRADYIAGLFAVIDWGKVGEKFEKFV